MKSRYIVFRRFLAFSLAVGVLISSIGLTNCYAEEAPKDSFVVKAIEWLRADQNEDGSWGKSDTSFVDTSEVSEYLAENNTLEDNLKKSTAWMENIEILNNDEAARVLPLIKDSNKHKSIKGNILHSQNEDGGWGIAEGYESDVLDTALVLKSLVKDSNSQTSVMQKAASYLVNTQESNGSWSFDDQNGSSVFLTSQVIIALNSFMTMTSLSSDELESSLRKSGEFLVSAQNEDKTWGTDENSISDTLLAYRAVLCTLGEDPVKTTLTPILSAQNEDGSWYESPYTTALAITAINEEESLPSASIDSIELLKDSNGTKYECDNFNAFETFEIKVQSACSNCNSNLLYFIKDPDNNIFQISSKGDVCWDTSSHQPGTYSVIAAIEDNKTGKILVSSEKKFTIHSTVKVINAEVNLDVDATTVGKAVNVNAKTTIATASNIDKQFTVKTRVLDSGAEVFSSEKIVDIKAAEQTKSFDVMSFSPNVETVKNYIVESEIYGGDEKLAEGQSIFKVESLPPETRIDASQALNKDKLYPGKDSVDAAFSLEGLGTTLPKKSSNFLRLASSAQSSSGYANGKMYNDYIEYAVASSGRFTIGTTGGNPDLSTDNNQILLYGHPNPRTSYTTLKIDGNNYVYSASKQGPTPDSANLSNTSECEINNLNVKQILSIVSNSNTKRDDIVQIKYVVTNNDTVDHNIGSRIMLDTMLGDNDAAPFRVPGIGALTTELELTGNKIPEYWQAFNSLTYPTVVSQGTFLHNGDNNPDKVQFTNWNRAYNNSWLDSVNTGASNGDSAVSVYWNPKSIAPGETREYVTYYGLSEFQQDSSGSLAVSLAGATDIAVKNNSYDPNPFTVTTYLSNEGSNTIKNVRANIVLPDGLKLADGQPNEKDFSSLNSWQDQQTSWNVEIEPSAVERNLTYSVVVSADGISEKTLTRKIHIPALNDDTSGKNVVLETNIPKGSMQIDASKLTPAPAEKIDNDDGSTTLRWSFDRISIGEEKTIKIEYTGANLIPDSDVLLTHNTKLTYLDRNNKTVAENLSDLKISVTKYSVDSKIITDKASYSADENVNITNSVKNLTDYPSSLTGKIQIIDSNGKIVKTLAEDENVTWNAGESKNFTSAWNTGKTMAGSYIARATWSDGNNIISVADTVFCIEADADISCDVTTDKQKYLANEDVDINAKIKNNSTNDLLNNLVVKTVIKNAKDQTIWNTENEIQKLLPTASTVIKNIWNTDKNAPGKYSVTIEIYKNESKLSQSCSSFEIDVATDKKIGVSGSLQILNKKICRGDAVTFNYILNNTGNVDLSDITAKILIINPETKEVFDTISKKASIDVSSSYSASTAWTHKPLTLGTYLVVLDALMPDGSEIPIDSSCLNVELPVILQNDAFRYALFSSSANDPLCMYLYKAVINGNVRTNKSFEFSGTNLVINGICSSFGQINTWGQTIQIRNKETDSNIFEMPDVTNEAKQIALADGTLSDASLNVTDYGKGINFSKSQISNGSIQINGNNFTSQGYLVANNNVSFNANSVRSTAANGIVICSTKGDISFNATNTDLKGIIYAPNGTVYVNCNTFNLAGRIIAKRIIVNCTNFSATSSQSDLDLLDCSLIQ